MRRHAIVATPSQRRFVKTLWDLVSGRPEETLCQWDTCGRRVVFTDPQRFAAQVCPQHFRHSNWSSFSRMLNMYDFRKVSRKPRAAVGGSQVQVFEHDHFRRGGEPRAAASFSVAFAPSTGRGDGV